MGMPGFGCTWGTPGRMTCGGVGGGGKHGRGVMTDPLQMPAYREPIESLRSTQHHGIAVMLTNKR